MNQFLSTRYVKGGRGPKDYDCWGLVRDARAALFNKPLLPLLTDAKPGDVRSITRAFQIVSPGMRGVEGMRVEPGAIATGWRARLCVHVGLVVEADGTKWILETDVGTGPVLTKISNFERRYTTALYHDD